MSTRGRRTARRGRSARRGAEPVAEKPPHDGADEAEDETDTSGRMETETETDTEADASPYRRGAAPARSQPLAKRRRLTDLADDPRTIAYQLAMELLQSHVSSADGTLSPASVLSVERIMQHTFNLVAFAKRHSPTPYPASLGVFCILPTEVLLHLFSFMAPRDLCALRPVCNLFSSLTKDPSLWRTACFRDLGEANIPNKLHLSLNKSWEWLYQAKAVKFSARDGIRDKQVGTYENTGFISGRWEGQWKRPAGSIFSRSPAPSNLHGYGLHVDDVQTLYEGEFEDGRLHGYGRQLESIPQFEREYEGYFKHGVWQGKGTCRYADGRSYDGMWESGRQNGVGTMAYPDGRRYEGQWCRGRRHGEGTLQWPCGARYIGQWIDDNMAGGGCFTLSGGVEIRTATVEEALTIILARVPSTLPETLAHCRI